ncbi:MAG TPA: two-component system activity regulator YycH [Bacillus sp. (in: firmicutes)]
MKYENIKSVILTLLVGISLLVTWNLWTYQPSYKELENADTVQEVSLSSKKEIKDIVKPDQVIFHKGNKYFGTSEDLELENIMTELSRWNFDHFKNISAEIENIYEIVENNEVVNILYSGSIPISLYKSVLLIRDKNVPSFNFDQIVINMEVEQNGFGVIYFISHENQQIYQSMVPIASISSVKEKYFRQAEQYNPYFQYKMGSNKMIYLPEDETQLVSYQYLTTPLNAGKLKDALFSDPSRVQKDVSAIGEEYKDASNLMKVNNVSNMILYVDLAEEETQAINSNDLLHKSINFVNEHGGWTDNYRYVELDNAQKAVLFRLYLAGYPIFSENSNVSELRLEWGKTDISSYERSNFSRKFSTSLLKTTYQTNMQSGHEVLERIQQMDSFNSNLLEDISIGYQMKKDSQSLLVDLEPCWYYLYDGDWKPLTFEGVGGE